MAGPREALYPASLGVPPQPNSAEVLSPSMRTISLTHREAT